MSNRRDWMVGETIVLTITVTEPDSSILFDPDSVMLASLKCGTTPVVLDDPDFTEVTLGLYRYTLDTDGMAPGKYTWRVVATKAAVGVAMAEDYFILRDPS